MDDVCGMCGKPLEWEALTPEYKVAKCCGRRYSFQLVQVERKKNYKELLTSCGYQIPNMRHVIDQDYHGCINDNYKPVP